MVKSVFFKPFVFLLMLVVTSLSVTPASTEASTSELEKAIEEVDYETGIVILKALKFNEDKTAFIDFDREYAESKGLKSEDLVNIEVFFDLEDEAFLLFKDAKLEFEDNSYSITAAKPIKDLAVIAAAIASIYFVGKAVITRMTNDLYTLGAKKFCRSNWPKKYSKIKTACKDLGYN